MRQSPDPCAACPARPQLASGGVYTPLIPACSLHLPWDSHPGLAHRQPWRVTGGFWTLPSTPVTWPPPLYPVVLGLPLKELKSSNLRTQHISGPLEGSDPPAGCAPDVGIVLGQRGDKSFPSPFPLKSSTGDKGWWVQCASHLPRPC